MEEKTLRQHLDDMQEARGKAKAACSRCSSSARLEARADSLGRLTLLEELLSAHRGMILLRSWVVSMLLAWAMAIQYYWRHGRGPQGDRGATTTALLWTIPIVFIGTLRGWNKAAIPQAPTDGREKPRMPSNPLFAELLQQISEEQAFYQQQEAQLGRRSGRRKRSGGGNSTRRRRSGGEERAEDRSARKPRSSGRGSRKKDWGERSSSRRWGSQGDTDDDDDEDEEDDDEGNRDGEDDDVDGGSGRDLHAGQPFHRQASFPAVLRRHHLEDMDDGDGEEDGYRGEGAARQAYHRQSSLPTVLRRRRRRGDGRNRSPGSDGDRDAGESLATTTAPMTAAGAVLRGMGWLLTLVPLTIMSLVKGYIRLVFTWLVYWPVSLMCYLPAMAASRMLGRGNEAKNTTD